MTETTTVKKISDSKREIEISVSADDVRQEFQTHQIIREILCHVT